jgi:hypothetical protein
MKTDIDNKLQQGDAPEGLEAAVSPVVDNGSTCGFSKLSKEQWTDIERELSGVYGRVELLCDGYKVNAVIKQKTALKFVITVYVDGVIKGEWFRGEAEEAKKFHCATKYYAYKAAARAEAKTKLKSKRLHASLKDHYKHVAEASTTFWFPYWTSPKAFCRHLRKTCQSISIVKIGYGN